MSKLAYTIEEAAEATGLGVKKLRAEIRIGHLKTKRSARDKDGNGIGQHVILASELQDFLDGLADG